VSSPQQDVGAALTAKRFVAVSEASEEHTTLKREEGLLGLGWGILEKREKCNFPRSYNSSFCPGPKQPAAAPLLLKKLGMQPEQHLRFSQQITYGLKITSPVMKLKKKREVELCEIGVYRFLPIRIIAAAANATAIITAITPPTIVIV